jgi:predicted MPP superfamily phosphohydrolase
LLGTIVGAPFGHARSSGQVTALVVFAAASVLLAAGYFGSQSLVVREVDVSIPSLPAEFDGLRIVQLSDTHIGPHIPARFLERVVRTVRTLEPDLIAVTGDLIDDRAEDVAVYAKALGSLSAPDGVFMIPGNHDVYAGWDAVARNLRASINGHVLVNEAHVIRRGHAALTIVGTGDPAGVQRGLGANVAPDIARAYATVDDNSVVIALAHNPSLWPALAKRGAALTLSGHTHWGQFAVPHRNWSLASRFQPHAMGVHTDGDSMLYISPGTGYWGIPFRIGARPEVTLVRLRRATSTDIQMGEARRAA